MTAEEIERLALPGKVKTLEAEVKELKNAVFGTAEAEPLPEDITDPIEFVKTVTDPQVPTEAGSVGDTVTPPTKLAEDINPTV